MDVILSRCHAAGTMVNFATFARDHWVNILVPIGFVIGWYLDKQQDQKLTAFRNKSALYGRELKPGEEVTWK
ncbi:NADH dehydrogenase [ubiquinone] 1 beta subcomplex subunit 1 isoform X1 [Myripristis murdjan]|nr:NADH dehydrogenase [ubiquinone] 1 beta subcomplex subunit 1 isoform X1 [Myripristis murdjan]